MTLSKKHSEFFAKCMTEEFENAGISSLTGALTLHQDEEITKRALSPGINGLAFLLNLAFTLPLIFICSPIFQWLAKESFLFFPAYFVFFICVITIGNKLTPEIIGKLFDKQIRKGCREYAVHVAENIDDYFKPSPELSLTEAIQRSPRV